MGTTIASASVRISPDFTDFEAEVEAKTRGALASASANVKVGADTDDADAKIAGTDAELDRINGRTVTARVRVDTPDSQKVEGFDHALSGLATTAITLGPTLIPVAGALAAVSGGFAATAGAVGLGAGTVILAFHGMSAAIEAMNKQALDPSKANLAAQKVALDGLTPPAQKFVQFLVSDLEPGFAKMQKTAGNGLFPGVTKGAKDLLTVLPDVDKLIGIVSRDVGKIGSETGKAFSGDEAKDFLNFLDGSVTPTLNTTIKIVGNVASGFIGLIENFQPVETEIGGGLLRLSQRFASFGQDSYGNGFQTFIVFLQKEGPQVVHTFEALGGAAEGLAKGLEPIGAIELKALTPTLEFVADLGNSHPEVITALGAAFITVSVGLKAIQAVKGLQSTASDIGGLFGAIGKGKGAAGILGGAAKGCDGLCSSCSCGGKGIGGKAAGAAEGDAEGAAGADVAVGAEAGAAVGAVSIAATVATLLPVVGGLVAAYEVSNKYSKNPGSLGPPGHDALTHETVGRGSAPVYNAAGRQPVTTSALELKAAAAAANDLSSAEARLAVTAGNGSGALTGNTKAAKDNRAALGDATANLKNYRDYLLATGEPLDTVNKKVGAAAKSLKTEADNTYSSAAAVRAFLAAHHALPSQLDQSTHGFIEINGQLVKIPGTMKDAAAGVTAGGKTIATSATAAAHAATNAMGAAAADAKTAGEDFSGGFAAGIIINEGAALAAGDRVGKETAQQLRNSIQAKSPSQLTYKTGVDFNQGFADGITASTATVVAAVTKSAKSAATALQTEIGKDLSKADSRLSTLRGDASSVKSSAVSNAQGLGDVGQFGSQTSIGQVLSILGKQTTLDNSFDTNLRKDRGRGLDKTAYNELVTEGPAQDANIAALLAHATKAQIAEFNKYEDGLTAAGTTTGKRSATYLYGKQIDAATKVVRDLRDDQHTANELLKKIADKKTSNKDVVDAIHALARVLANQPSYKQALDAIAHDANTKRRSRPRGARG